MKRGNITKFGRVRKVRKAFVRSLVTALVEYEKIKTTRARAKTLSTKVEKLITTAKKQNLASRRIIAREIGERATKKLVSEVSPKFSAKNGGYTRITRLEKRKSDGAPMVLIEFAYPTEPVTN